MVDSGYDFLTPELLNLIFFQQKSLVIFPYVDQKHLKLLEVFAVGHSIIDLDCTSVEDVLSIVEFESGAYSQTPNLYFIYNATKDIIASLLDRETVHCIVNTHEDVSQLVSGQNLIFYNKKSRKYLNHEFDSQDLRFEKELIDQSRGNALILQDLLLHVKSIATQVYVAIVEENNNVSIPSLFNQQAGKFHSKHWSRILEFMENYFKIQSPPDVIKKVQEVKVFGNGGTSTQTRINNPLADFSSEYELIIAVDRAIGNAFVQALHEYRSKHVNSANLEISQLYNPKELYNYLRNHHWKNGIDEIFVDEWFKPPDLITEENVKRVKIVLRKLGISHELVIDKEIEISETLLDSSSHENNIIEDVQRDLNLSSKRDKPSIQDFNKFKVWILKKLDEIESRFCN